MYKYNHVTIQSLCLPIVCGHQVKVMELSDALESAGSYSKAEISERLQKYRDKLMQESVEPSRSPRHKSLRKSRSPSPSTLGTFHVM